MKKILQSKMKKEISGLRYIGTDKQKVKRIYLISFLSDLNEGHNEWGQLLKVIWLVQKPVTKSIAKAKHASIRFLWEEQYDASQEDATAFYIPCQEILNRLNLIQKEFDGYYYDKNNVLVAFDGNITNQDYGLVMRRDYLDKYLKKVVFGLFGLFLEKSKIFLAKTEQRDKNGRNGMAFSG